MCLSLNGYAQNEITFKIQYKPETTYSQIIEQISDSEMKYSGSEEFLQMITKSGIKNPISINQKFKIESVCKTGKMSDGVNFPLTIELTKITTSDGVKPMPDGIIFSGHGSIDKMLTIDSIVSDKLDEELKKKLLQSMQNIYAQLSFPEKKIKTGESFTIETPLSIPVGKEKIDMNLTNNYTLLSVVDGIADFDVSQLCTMKMKSTVEEYALNAKGSGKGKLLYDVANNCVLKMQTDSNLEMVLKFETMNIEYKGKIASISTTVAKKN